MTRIIIYEAAHNKSYNDKAPTLFVSLSVIIAQYFRNEFK